MSGGSTLSCFGMGSVRGEKTFQTRCQGENCWWGNTRNYVFS